jgi:N-acetylglutamate synthase-like GNAT family acetyltransferase
LAVAHAAIPYDYRGNERWLRERQQVDEQRCLRRHYVLEDGGREIVGYGAIEQQLPDSRQRLRLYLLVSPGYLRSGGGRALYGQLMKDVEALKVTGLWMREYQQDNELMGFMYERGFVQTRLTWEQRLTLMKANVGQMVQVVEEVAGQGVIISNLEEERKRTPDFAGRLHALYNGILGDDFAPLPFPAFVQLLDRPRIMPQGFFFARDGEQLVGMGALAYVEGDSEQAVQRWTGVLPAYRRRHIGIALRLCCMDAALRLGYQTLVTYTDHQERVMLRLDEKLGFHRLFGYVTLEKTVVGAAPSSGRLT